MSVRGVGPVSTSPVAAIMGFALGGAAIVWIAWRGTRDDT